VKRQAGDQAGALAAYQEDLDIARKLAALDPGNAQARRDVFVSLTEVASVMSQATDHDAALTLLREALVIAETLAKLDDGNAQAKDDLAWVRQRIETMTK